MKFLPFRLVSPPSSQGRGSLASRPTFDTDEERQESIAARERDEWAERARGCCREECEKWRQRVFDEASPNAKRKQTTRAWLLERWIWPSCSTKKQAPKATTNFLDLPPELREQIYVDYFEAYSQQRLTPYRLPSPLYEVLPQESYYKPIPPHEAPITRVCRLLRNESLPLFYSAHRMPIVAHIDEDWDCIYGATEWYRRLHPEKLQAIRKLEVYFCFEMNSRGQGFTVPFAVSFDVDLDPEANAVNVSRHVQQGQRVPSEERLGEYQYWKWRRLDDYVRRAAQTFVKYSDMRHLTADDLHRLVPEDIDYFEGWKPDLYTKFPP